VDKRTNLCVEPVCYPGFYRCCFDCHVSTCARDELGVFPNGALTLSKRGVMECVECKPGDVCSGCDEFEECPSTVESSTQGTARVVPQISAPGSASKLECQKCPDGYDADTSLDRCVPQFRASCEKTLLEICMLGCKVNPTNDECETLACKLYCAKDQEKKNPECLKSFEETCNELNSYIDPDTITTIIATTTPLTSLMMSDDSGIAQVVPINPGRRCNLICSNSNRRFIPFNFNMMGASSIITFVILTTLTGVLSVLI